MRKQLDKRLFFSMTMDFLEVYLPREHESKKTVKTYRDGLTIFRRYVTDTLGLSVKTFSFEQCTFSLVLGYRNWLLDSEGRKNSTANNRLAAIKAYLRYAADMDVSIQQTYLNVSDVPFLKVPKEIRPIIEGRDALRDLLDAPPNTKTGCRDTMILSMLFDTMIRAGELIRLDLKDIRCDAQTPYVFVHGKGNKERTVPMSDGLVKLVEAYIAEYHSTEPTACADTPFIYTTIHGVRNRMSERNVERIVKKYADVIRDRHPELPASVYPHMFRRTRGTGLYRDGVPIEAIAVAMGHSSIQTTRDHYASPSLEQKKAVMDQGDGLVISEKNADREWPDDEDEMARLCGLR